MFCVVNSQRLLGSKTDMKCSYIHIWFLVCKPYYLFIYNLSGTYVLNQQLMAAYKVLYHNQCWQYDKLNILINLVPDSFPDSVPDGFWIRNILFCKETPVGCNLHGGSRSLPPISHTPFSHTPFCSSTISIPFLGFFVAGIDFLFYWNLLIVFPIFLKLVILITKSKVLTSMLMKYRLGFSF